MTSPFTVTGNSEEIFIALCSLMIVGLSIEKLHKINEEIKTLTVHPSVLLSKLCVDKLNGNQPALEANELNKFIDSCFDKFYIMYIKI